MEGVLVDRRARGGIVAPPDAPLWRPLGGGRVHARHGPIELELLVDADARATSRAHAAAREAFAPLLGTLAAELALLRAPLAERSARPEGAVARRMHRAVLPYRARTVTPMAAVAGAVADHLLEAVLAVASPRRAFVNDGGDIALGLAPGETLRVALCADPSGGHAGAAIELGAADGVGGVATSGWRGRSHSLGIADAVTVLAPDAAGADVAATLIANAVDLPGSERVRRVAAAELAPDSDLGDRPVTVDVAPLDARERHRALAPALAFARELVRSGRIVAVWLELQGMVAVVGRERLGEVRGWAG